jgi:hypothetical protein
MNFRPPGSTSITRNINNPQTIIEDVDVVIDQAERILQLVEIVCPDEFLAYLHLLLPYWRLFNSWAEQGLLEEGEEEKVIGTASYEQMSLLECGIFRSKDACNLPLK